MMKDMGFRRLICAGLLAASLLFGGASLAHAACTSPAGYAGEIVYNKEFHFLQYCNDTAWMPIVKPGKATLYMPHATYFDGVDDYYIQSSVPANLSDGKTVTGSVWVQRETTGTIDTIFSINDRFIFRIDSAGDVSLVAENTADTDILDASTSTGPLNDTNWHHIMFSIDMGNSANNRVYVDSTDYPLSYVANLNQNIDFTVTTHVVGASMTGTNQFVGNMSDMWIDVGRFVDLDLEINRKKFYDFLTYLGPNGSRPFGEPPDFFFSGPYMTQATNKGTAGGWAASPLGLLRAGVPMPTILGPSGCDTIGAVCADGTVYAGLTPDGRNRMMTTAADLPGTYTWNGGVDPPDFSPMEAVYGTCFEDNDVGEGETCITGERNTAFLATAVDPDGPYVAAQACADSTENGHSDWFLPSQVELYALYIHSAAIGGFSAVDYWSSSESHIVGDAQYMDFNSGVPYRAPHEDSKNVRCVRIAGCEGPIGKPGEIVFHEDYRVLQYCDGFVWHGLGDVNPPGSLSTCVSPDGDPGEVVFHSQSKSLQYCDGTNWQDLAGHVMGCGTNPVAGQRCPDGTIYAGLSPDSNARMYALPTDPADLAWSAANTINTSMVNCTTATSPGAQSSCQTGENNTALLAGLSNSDAPYHAASYCYNLVAHGRDDWYLPAMDELNVLYTVRTTGAFSGTFNGTGNYMSSSEYSDTWYRFHNFGAPLQDQGSKLVVRDFRCVRKDDPCATGSPLLGTVCESGMVYAGLSPDGNVPMYTTRVDAGTMVWNNNSTNWFDTALTNCNNDGSPQCTQGEASTGALVGAGDIGAPYTAANYCENLNIHGHSDWYLPSVRELDVLWTNRTVIGNFNLTGTAPGGYYWSSSEYDSMEGLNMQMSTSSVGGDNKNTALNVRCVRR